MEPKFLISQEPTVEGLAYASASPNQLLDLYLPDDMSHRPPLVVAIHGGRFSLGTRRWELAHVPALLESGWAVASVEYRLSQEAAFPAAVQDCKAAVRWLRSRAHQFGFDPDRFIAWGRSAGGNLAALIGTTGSHRTRFDDGGLGEIETSAAVQAVVDWYGPSDFSLIDKHFAEHLPPGGADSSVSTAGANSPFAAYLGAELSRVPELVQESNPITYVGTGSELPPFFLAAGDADRKVPYHQSVILGEALERAGAAVELHILAGAGHGAVQFEEEMTPLVLRWLRRLGLAPAARERS
jgi:acetyl esterase/lipase